MRVAVLGRGKTGRHVIDILRESNEHELHEVYHSENPPTADKLQQAQALISFIPAAAMREHLETIIKSKIFHITGCTGYDWNKEITSSLQMRNCTWIQADNFSLGMAIVKKLIKQSQQFKEKYYNEINIHEVHHTSKVDKPSGTAKLWEKWFDGVNKITSERYEDVVGIHQAEIKMDMESINISHQALDRRVFASGAVRCLDKLRTLTKPGFYHFDEII